MLLTSEYHKRTGVVSCIFQSLGQVTVEVYLDGAGVGDSPVRCGLDELVMLEERIERMDTYLATYQQSFALTTVDQLPPSREQVYKSVSEKLIVLGRGTMTAEEAKAAAAKEGLTFWTHAMVNTAMPSNRGYRMIGDPDALAYVYQEFGVYVSTTWHARIGGPSTIDKPCKTEEEAALIAARELQSRGCMPPSEEELAMYKQNVAKKLKQPSEWRPHPKAELLTLQLAPTSKSGYMHVSLRQRKTLRGHAKPTTTYELPPYYVCTLAGYAWQIYQSGPAAAWHVAYCKKYGRVPPDYSDDDSDDDDDSASGSEADMEEGAAGSSSAGARRRKTCRAGKAPAPAVN